MLSNQVFQMPTSRTQGILAVLLLKEIIRRGLVEESMIEQKTGEIQEKVNDEQAKQKEQEMKQKESEKTKVDVKSNK
jgi:hypothetical protein